MIEYLLCLLVMSVWGVSPAFFANFLTFQEHKQKTGEEFFPSLWPAFFLSMAYALILWVGLGVIAWLLSAALDFIGPFIALMVAQ